MSTQSSGPRQSKPMRRNAAVRMEDEVKEVERNGRTYLVFPLIAAREMVLNYPEHGTKELLPADKIAESVDWWAGTPITFIHPENRRQTADHPTAYVENNIGQAHDPELVDDDKLRVMAWVDVDKATDIGGMATDVVNSLRNGDELSVSAGYSTVGDSFEGGTFEGERYDVEQGMLIPDHIAVFPSDEFRARCSPEDGCAAPRVNAMAHTCSPGPCECGCHVERINTLDSARTPTYDGTTSGEWEPPSFTEYVEEWYERKGQSAPDAITTDSVRQDALQFAASRTLLGDADADESEDVVSYPVVNLDDELNENALDSAIRLRGHQSDDTAESILETSRSLLRKEFDREFEKENAHGEMAVTEGTPSDVARDLASTLVDGLEMVESYPRPSRNGRYDFIFDGVTEDSVRDEIISRLESAGIQKFEEYYSPMDGHLVIQLRESQLQPTVGDDMSNEIDDETAATLGHRILSALGITTNAEGVVVEGDEDGSDSEGTETPDEDDSSTESQSEGTETPDEDDSSTETEPEDPDQDESTSEESGESTETDTPEEPDDEGTENQETDTDTDTMPDTLSVEQLAAKSAFGMDQLQEWDEDQLTALEQTILENNPELREESMDEGGDDEESTNTESEETEEEMTTNSNGDGSTELDELRSELEETKAMVEDVVNQKQNAQRREKAKVVANAVDPLTVDDAMNLDDDRLDELAEEHRGVRGNYAAVPGTASREVDRGGADEEEVEEYPAGGRRNYESRAGGDD